MTFDPRDLDACVSCGLCLTSCPTYDVTRLEHHGPRGRIEGMRAVQRGELDVLDPDYVESMETCVQCRACELACPSAVPFGSLMETARHELADARAGAAAAAAPRSDQSDGGRGTAGSSGGRRAGLRASLLRLAQRGMLVLVAAPRLLAVASRALRLVQRSGLQRLVPEPLRVERPIRWARGRGRVGNAHTGVHLYRGCVMDQWFGDVQEAARQVLVAAGHRPATERLGRCCGALHLHAGDGPMARRLAQETIEAYGAADTPIVVASAGCGAAMKEYGRLVGTPEAARFAARVRDLSEVVVATDLPLRTDLPAMSVSWQAPCHLRNVQRVDDRARDLLAALPGVDVLEPSTGQPCCGAGGGYRLSQPDFSQAIGERVAAAHAAQPADHIVSANPGCMMQLCAEGLEVQHLAQTVAARLATTDRTGPR